MTSSDYPTDWKYWKENKNLTPADTKHKDRDYSITVLRFVVPFVPEVATTWLEIELFLTSITKCFALASFAFSGISVHIWLHEKGTYS